MSPPGPAPPRLRQLVWPIDHPFLDTLLDGPPGLVLRVRGAVNAAGPTVLAVVGVAADGRTEALYGGALTGAVLLVALGLETGSVHVGTVAPPRALPAALARPDRPPAETGETGETGEETGGVTAAELAGVDLVRLLGLPRDGGRYAVLAWLDGMVSEPAVIRSPAGGAPPAPAATHPLLRACPAPLPPPPAPRLTAGDVLLLPTGAGAAALVALDGARREWSAAGWAPRPAAVDLAPYRAALAPSPYPARLLCHLAGARPALLALA